MARVVICLQGQAERRLVLLIAGRSTPVRDVHIVSFWHG
jgi:hypothetical protein